MKRAYKITLIIGLTVFLIGQLFDILFSKLYSAYIFLVDFQLFSDFLKNIFWCLFISAVSVGVLLVCNTFIKMPSKKNAGFLCLLSGGIALVKLFVTLSELIRNIHNFNVHMKFLPDIAIKNYGSIQSICLKYVKDGSIFVIIGLIIIAVASVCYLLSKEKERTN